MGLDRRADGQQRDPSTNQPTKPRKPAMNVQDFNEEDYVDVRTLPLKPPQPMLPPERPARRPWHPVMWDSSIVGIPPPDHSVTEDEPQPHSREYPHKQRIRNLRRLIADGKVKPTPETLIFFLCNKFAISDERQKKVPAQF